MVLVGGRSPWLDLTTLEGLTGCVEPSAPSNLFLKLSVGTTSALVKGTVVFQSPLVGMESFLRSWSREQGFFVSLPGFFRLSNREKHDLFFLLHTFKFKAGLKQGNKTHSVQRPGVTSLGPAQLWS